MQKLKILFLILTFFCISATTLADSPVTSIEIWKAYNNKTAVVEAGNSNGILNESLFDYLVNDANPVAVKMAVINRISWDSSGKTNAQKFIAFLQDKNMYATREAFLENGKDDELLSYAYLMAMDDYFDVEEAITIADKALQKKPGSYTYQIVTAIIKAQDALHSNWGNVYEHTDNVRKNDKLIADMNDEAISIIFEYMDIYKKHANEK